MFIIGASLWAGLFLIATTVDIFCHDWALDVPQKRPESKDTDKQRHSQELSVPTHTENMTFAGPS